MVHGKQEAHATCLCNVLLGKSHPKLGRFKCRELLEHPATLLSHVYCMYIGIPIFKILGTTLDCQGNMMTLPLDAFSVLPSSIWSVLEMRPFIIIFPDH